MTSSLAPIEQAKVNFLLSNHFFFPFLRNIVLPELVQMNMRAVYKALVLAGDLGDVHRDGRAVQRKLGCQLQKHLLIQILLSIHHTLLRDQIRLLKRALRPRLVNRHQCFLFLYEPLSNLVCTDGKEVHTLIRIVLPQPSRSILIRMYEQWLFLAASWWVQSMCVQLSIGSCIQLIVKEIGLPLLVDYVY